MISKEKIEGLWTGYLHPWRDNQAPLFQTVNNYIPWINHHSLNEAIGFPHANPLDSNLSGELLNNWDQIRNKTRPNKTEIGHRDVTITFTYSWSWKNFLTSAQCVQNETHIFQLSYSRGSVTSCYHRNKISGFSTIFLEKDGICIVNSSWRFRNFATMVTWRNDFSSLFRTPPIFNPLTL